MLCKRFVFRRRRCCRRRRETQKYCAKPHTAATRFESDYKTTDCIRQRTHENKTRT